MFRGSGDAADEPPTGSVPPSPPQAHVSLRISSSSSSSSSPPPSPSQQVGRLYQGTATVSGNFLFSDDASPLVGAGMPVLSAFQTSAPTASLRVPVTTVGQSLLWARSEAMRKTAELFPVLITTATTTTTTTTMAATTVSSAPSTSTTSDEVRVSPHHHSHLPSAASAPPATAPTPAAAQQSAQAQLFAKLGALLRKAHETHRRIDARQWPERQLAAARTFARHCMGVNPDTLLVCTGPCSPRT